jgi:hypothetical protein
MRTLRTLSCLAWLVLAVGTPACHLRAVEAPYAANAAPSAAELLAAANPRISALQVSSAKVRIGRSPAATLMFLAQKPGRFSGQVQIAGRELVSLAFHEQGYALRNVAADGLPAGYYAGPPADCAIRQLIGVPFSASELIALVLGGSPIIAGPHEIVEQRWDRRRPRGPAAAQPRRGTGAALRVGRRCVVGGREHAVEPRRGRQADPRVDLATRGAARGRHDGAAGGHLGVTTGRRTPRGEGHDPLSLADPRAGPGRGEQHPRERRRRLGGRGHSGRGCTTRGAPRAAPRRAL